MFSRSKLLRKLIKISRFNLKCPLEYISDENDCTSLHEMTKHCKVGGILNVQDDFRLVYLSFRSLARPVKVLKNSCAISNNDIRLGLFWDRNAYISSINELSLASAFKDCDKNLYRRSIHARDKKTKN